MFFPYHLCPLKPEQQLIKSSLGAHSTRRSREATVSCQSVRPLERLVHRVRQAKPSCRRSRVTEL